MWVCSECGHYFARKGFHMTKHGQSAWNKGLTKETNESVARIGEKGSLARKGKPTGKVTYSSRILGQERFDSIEIERRKKISAASKLMWQDPEYREKVLPTLQANAKNEKRIEKVRVACSKVGKSNIGKRPWNKGLTKETSDSVRICSEKIALSNKNPSEKRLAGRLRATAKKKTYRGDKASNWQGGKSFQEYGNEWNEELRDEIRKRDQYTCQDCGKKQEELVKSYSKLLDVHHVDFEKKRSIAPNLVTLCRSCHQTRHPHTKASKKLVDL